MERFKREIRLARKITHRNVLRTFDYGEAEGVYFISMEFVRGYTLSELTKATLEREAGKRQLISEVADQFEATLVWLHPKPLVPGRPYLMKTGSGAITATVTAIKHRLNVDSLERLAAKAEALAAKVLERVRGAVGLLPRT